MRTLSERLRQKAPDDKKVVYVAGKFRGPTPWHVERNVRRAEEMAMLVAEGGMVPLCPHTMFRYFDKSLDDEFWLTATLELLARCDAMILCEGWQSSAGTIAEIAYMEKLGRPVLHGLADLRRWTLAVYPAGDPGAHDVERRCRVCGGPGLLLTEDAFRRNDKCWEVLTPGNPSVASFSFCAATSAGEET